MKKNLLIASALVVLMMQAEISFGKCDLDIEYSLYSESYSNWIAINNGNFIYLNSGDTIFPHLINHGICFGCVNPPDQEGWFRNGTLAALIGETNFRISLSGFYEYKRCADGLMYYWWFTVTVIPAGIADNINSTNSKKLNYTITNLCGQVLESGKFSGEIILREKNITRNFAPGIYFVTYSDADDNRQVITDKVFVGNQ
jgi:hypothetical protein